MRRIIIPLTLIFSFCLLSLSDAQDPRAKRRAFVEDLLKGLIESQLDRGQPNNHQGQHNHNPRQPNTRPPVVVEASREMRDVRRHLASWNQTCGNLIQEIRHHEYESPQLRPLLADTLKVKANIELLNRKAQIYPTVQPLVEDFRLIDQDWRMLSYRLKASGGLTNECAQFVGTIAELDSQLCGLFQIQPQVNRRELLRLATQLSSEYNHLLHDVYYVVRSQQGGQQLVNQGKNLQTMMSQATALLRRGDYDSIVSAYQQCIGQWKKFSRKLHRFQDERLRQSIADIEITGRLIHEQLWLPVDIDREYLASLSNAVARDASQIFNSVTMAQLLNLRAPELALNSAREFQDACAGFSQSVRSGTPVEDLEWDFRLFEVQWQNVHHLFHELKVPQIDHKLEDIEAAMLTLNDTFGDAPAINHGMMLQMTGSLFANCQQMNTEIHRRIVEPRYSHEFHEQLCGEVDQLARSVNLINQRVVQSHNHRLGRGEFDLLFNQWRNVKTMMNNCKPQDRQAFSGISGAKSNL